jgi:threonine dehydratase
MGCVADATAVRDQYWHWIGVVAAGTLGRVNIDDIRAAQSVLAAHLAPTPSWGAPPLDEVTGCRVLLKHEEVQPTGAFKVRGGLTLLAGMTEAEHAAGVVSASTGNHGQSLAYAARRFGARCRIVLPEPANPTKVRALRGWGAELVYRGECIEVAIAHGIELAERDGARFVHPANEPALIAGVGTLYLELLTAHPDLEYLVVPVGGGSGAASACLVAAEVAPDCRVIAVQSTASRAAHDSWRAARMLSRPNRTTLEGLATGCGYPMTQDVLRRHLADFVLVDDERVRAAQLLLLTHAHTMAEGAGAASLAGVLALRDRLAGARVGVVVTGGNASPSELGTVLGTGPGTGGNEPVASVA